MPNVLSALNAQTVIIAVIIVLAQYALALTAFVKISKINLTFRKLLIFNFLIVFVFYIGPIIAIIYAGINAGDKKDKADENNLDQ
ncbi:MAG TPA: hypothetical protein VIL23_00630 [Clostridia bacterium]